MRALNRLINRCRSLKRALFAPLNKSADTSLRRIDNLSLPASEQFPVVRDAADRIEGMLSPFSMAVMDTLLAFQQQLKIAGDILEIGTYRGKSAVILGHSLRPDESLTLVDIADYLDPLALGSFKDATKFILSPSEKLRSALPSYERRRRTFRFIHIDASHGFKETFNELGMAEELIADRGIVAMDDFANLHYSQNIAAIFKYLYTAKTELTPFLVTDEKAYLCRRAHFDDFAALVLETGLAEMKSRNMPAVLARTSYNPEYRAFYLRPRDASDESEFYGEAIYKDQLLGK